MTAYKKETLFVLQASSLRELVNTVNSINSTSPAKILKDDIVSILSDEDTWFLLYYK